MKTHIYLIITCFLWSCRNSGKKQEPQDSASVETQYIDSITRENPKSVRTTGVNQFWSEQAIASATLYCYYPEANYEIDNLILDKDDKLHYTALDSPVIELPQSTVRLLSNMLVNMTDYQEDVIASCFEPHHGIVLRNAESKTIGHISICFECNQYRVKPNHVGYIPMQFFRKLCNQAKVPLTRGQIMRLYNNQISG